MRTTLLIIVGLMLAASPAEGWTPSQSRARHRSASLKRVTQRLPLRLRERILRRIRLNQLRRTRTRTRFKSRTRILLRNRALSRTRLRRRRADRRSKQRALASERSRQKTRQQRHISKREIRTADRALSSLVNTQQRLKKDDPRRGAVEALISSMRQLRAKHDMAGYVTLSQSSLAKWANQFAQLKVQEKRAKFWQTTRELHRADGDDQVG